MAEQKRQDAVNVEEALNQSEAFLEKNKKAIIAVIAAVIIVIAGVVIYKNFIAEPRERKASEALLVGQQYFDVEEYQLALDGDSVGNAGFLKVADEFSGTKAGNLAQAYAGLCYAQLGKYKEALDCLEDFSGNDLVIAPAVTGAKGDCYAQLGELEKAASAFKEAADMADSQSMSPVYLVKAGQVYEKLGKNAEAVKVYQLIKDKYFNSYQAMEIDKYIERASK